MENKIFNLGHVVLYAKGWYQKSDNIWSDLKQMLEYDNYTPFDSGDVFWIITNMFEKSELGSNCNSLLQTLISTQPTECWKYGYNCTKETYDVSTATMYYILSSIRFLENKYHKRVIPKYNKITPRPKNIELRRVIEIFNTKNTK